MTSKYFILQHNNAKNAYMGTNGKIVKNIKDAATFYWDNDDKTITLEDKNIGPYSIEQVCETNCNGNGKCLHTKCVCDTGWKGDDCSQKTGGGGGNGGGNGKIGLIIGIISVVFLLGGVYFYFKNDKSKNKGPESIEMDSFN